MNRKQYLQLSQITAVVKFAHECERSDITGVKDSPQKIYACYLAQKCTEYSDRTIASFFNINPGYMESRIKDFSIQLLLDPEVKGILSQMEVFCDELELARIFYNEH